MCKTQIPANGVTEKSVARGSVHTAVTSGTPHVQPGKQCRQSPCPWVSFSLVSTSRRFIAWVSAAPVVWLRQKRKYLRRSEWMGETASHHGSVVSSFHTVNSHGHLMNLKIKEKSDFLADEHFKCYNFVMDLMIFAQLLTAWILRIQGNEILPVFQVI